AGQARAHLGGQRGQHGVGGAVGQRPVAQLFGRLYGRGGDGGIGGAGGAGREQQAGGEQGERKTAHAGTPDGGFPIMQRRPRVAQAGSHAMQKREGRAPRGARPSRFRASGLVLQQVADLGEQGHVGRRRG